MTKKVMFLMLLIITPFIVFALPKGDIDGDNKVDMNDYTLICKHIIASIFKNKDKSWSLTGDKLKRADADGKNGVDNADFVAIRNIIRGYAYSNPTATPKPNVTATPKPTGTVTPQSTNTQVTPITSITLNKTSVSIKTGNSINLDVTTSSGTISNSELTWTSSDKNIATVNSSGVVKGKKIGSATITAKTSNGKKATCNVTVKPKKILIIGNSKTYRRSNGLKNTRPALQFVTMAKEGKYISTKGSKLKAIGGNEYYVGLSDEITIVTNGGQMLKTSVTKSIYKKYIDKNNSNSKEFDIIVVQEKTGIIEDDYDTFYQGVETIINLQGGKNYKGLLYIRTSWPVDDKDLSNNLSKMNKNAEKAAQAIKDKYGINTYVIYDGNAFYQAKKDGIVVYRSATGDTNHQNENGAYLAALCMYVKIYHENATKVSNNLYTTNSSTANKLKKIANSICK